jgi:hypothetical protein
MSMWSGHFCQPNLKLLLLLLLNLLVKEIRIRSPQTGPTTTPAAKRRHMIAPDVSPG